MKESKQEMLERRGREARAAFLAGKKGWLKNRMHKTYGDLCEQFAYIILQYQPSIERVHKIHAAFNNTMAARGLQRP